MAKLHDVAGAPLYHAQAKSPIAVGESLLLRAADLEGGLRRIERKAEEVKGLLFGSDPECENGITPPEPFLSNLIERSIYAAENIERELDRIRNRLTGD